MTSIPWAEQIDVIIFISIIIATTTAILRHKFEIERRQKKKKKNYILRFLNSYLIDVTFRCPYTRSKRLRSISFFFSFFIFSGNLKHSLSDLYYNYDTDVKRVNIIQKSEKKITFWDF